MAFYGLLSAPEPPTQRAALAASSTSEIEMVAEIEVAPRSEIVDTMLPHVRNEFNMSKLGSSPCQIA